jgi:hypothetical protein
LLIRLCHNQSSLYRPSSSCEANGGFWHECDVPTRTIDVG